MIIVAGRFTKLDTDETQVLALRVTAKTPVLSNEGEPLAPGRLLELQEDQELVVTGSKTRRGVIRPEEVRLVSALP